MIFQRSKADYFSQPAFTSKKEKKKAKRRDHLPKTIANVLVAFRSFFADDFSRFFLLALFTL